MIYRLTTNSREYWLSGTPGIDLKAAFRRFMGSLSRDRGQRQVELQGVLAELEPEQPVDATEDLETRAFVAVACDSLDLRVRGLTEVNLATDSIRALIT